MQKYKSLFLDLKLAVITVLSCALMACGGGSGGGGSGGTSGGSSGGTGGSGQSSGLSAYSWAVGPNTYASGAIATYMPSMANLAANKVIAVFSQSETGGNKLYYILGDITAGTWTSPAQITGYSGVVQGLSGTVGTATVVSANPTTGVATAAWTSQVNGESTMRVWMSTYSYSSATWTTPIQIGTTSWTSIKISKSAAGGTLIGWISASTINLGTQVLNLYTIPASGSAVTDQLELGASPYYSYKIGLSDSNGVVAVWAGASQSVMLARKTGPTWAANSNLGTGALNTEYYLDLVVNADGSDAVAWAGVDPSIHTVVHNASGTQLSSQLVVQGASGNTRPALVSLGSGKYLMTFAAAALNGVGIAYFEPYSSSYTPGVGWSTPIALEPNSASGAGNQFLNVDSAGNALAINVGYNLNGYTLASGATTWGTRTLIVYGAFQPAFVQEKSTGRGVLLWTNSSQLQSAFFK